MEQFKICEKDTKKGLLKDGSQRESRNDPKEAERDDKRTWLFDCLERLEGVIENIESEIEKALNKGKSKNKEQVGS
jgi:CCR4-NOT transcriptional regulation complex NOT5 subunit